MEINDIEVEPISEANDLGFEPQARLRANTWPVRPRECATPEEASSSTPPVQEISENALDEYEASPLKDSGPGLAKKAGTRRNAWGSLSYADLITKAIDSTADKRLTLSQIYDWMVQNVPYFKDKGDNNSSAGWKNSIRHNLSLHNRFMRVQNEGTGKSSWWVINPDAKPGKTPRRRAASMDPEEMAKKRGRAKKRVEQLRSGDFENYRHNSNPGSEYNSNSDLSSIGGDPFTINPLDIRARTSSNASSFGRLSPIQAGMETELDDDFGPSWVANGKDFLMGGRHMTSGAESVSEHLAELFMSDPFANADIKPSVENHSLVHNPPAYSSHSPAIGMQLQPRNSFGIVRPDGMGTMSNMLNAVLSPLLTNEFGYPNKTTVSNVSLRDLLSDNVSSTALHQVDYSAELKYLQSGIPPNRNLPSPKELAGLTSPGSTFASPPSIHISPQHQQAMMARGVANFPLHPQQQQQLLQFGGGNVQAMQQRMSNDSLLQTVQMRGMQQQQMLRSPSHIKQEPGFPTSPINAKSEPVSPVSCLPHSPINNHHLGSRYSGSDLTRFVKQEHPVSTAGHYAAPVVAARPLPPSPLPVDLDFSLQELRASGLECDMDRILQEGNFDLEFQPGISGTYPYS